MSKSGDNTAAGLQVAASLINPFLGAGMAAVNFLFGGGGPSVNAMRSEWASNALVALNRQIGYRQQVAPPAAADGVGATWQATRDFYTTKNFAAKVGLPSTPPADFVAAWNAQDANRNPGAAEVGWQRYAESLGALRAKGYDDVPWRQLFANMPSDTKKAGDYLGLAVSMAPAVLEFLKPATVKPIPTGGPNPGVPQMAFVGAIPPLAAAAPEIIVTASRLPSLYTLARGALAGFGLLAAGGATVSKGPPTRARLLLKPPVPVKPAPVPVAPPPNPLPLEWPEGLDYTRPPLNYPRMPEITVTATRLRPMTLAQLQRAIPEVVTRVKRLRRPKPSRKLRPRLPRPQEIQQLAPALEAILSPRITSPSPKLQPARVTARLAAALAPGVATPLPTLRAPSALALRPIRLPATGLPPALAPGRPLQLATQTATSPATEECRCSCTDTSPKAERRRREQREKRKKRRCFSSTRALNDYIRNRKR